MLLAIYFIEEQRCGAYKLTLNSIDFHAQFEHVLSTELLFLWQFINLFPYKLSTIL